MRSIQLLRPRKFLTILCLLGFLVSYSQDIVINEINYRSLGDLNLEFVELYNDGPTSIDLAGWTLADGIEYTFPSGSTIRANGYIVVSASPADINTSFGISSLGPFNGKLSNSGDDIELLNADCVEIDKVEYEVWDEWPSVRHSDLSCPGNSFPNSPECSVNAPVERVVALKKSGGDENWLRLNPSNANLEASANSFEEADLFRVIENPSGCVSLISDYVGQVINPANAAGDTPRADVNTARARQSLFWLDQGNNQVSIFSEHHSRFFQADWTIDDVAINTAGTENSDFSTFDYVVIDEPCDDYTNAISIQLKNHDLPNNSAGSWSSHAPTPNAVNAQVFVSNASNVPVIRNVRKSPDKPSPNEDVRIRAEFSENENVFLGPIDVFLEYQINEPGDYKLKNEITWTSIRMLDDGVDADSTANNAVYTAKIPGNLNNHRNLVRFRVRVDQPSGADLFYPDERFDESNFAYYVYGNYPLVGGIDIATLDELPDVTIITKNSIANKFIGDSEGANTSTTQYQGNDPLGEGTLVYDGKVFDHVRFRPRGRGSRLERDKPGISMRLNNENPVTVKSDQGEDYDVKRDRLVFSGGWVNDEAGQGLTESLIYKMNELAGALPRYTDYVQLRVLDNVSETGNENGDFFGLYLLMEDYNGDYIEEHDFAEGNFWSTDRPKRTRILDHQGDFPNAASIPTFAPFNETRGSFTIDDRGHKPLLFADRIAAEIYGQNGINYVGKHSYNEYYDSATETYLGWWGDMDNAFGSPSDNVTVFPRVEARLDAVNADYLKIPESMQIEYQSEFRSTFDLLLDYTDPFCNCTQSDYLVDQESRKIYKTGAASNWVDLDKSRWPQINYDLGTYEAQRDWYKSWFQDRKVYLATRFNDADIPAKPEIEYTGSDALDELTFNNDNFSDPQGPNTFAAMEWRVGEWSDPSNLYYDQNDEAKYEIETKWRSGEINTFASSFQIPAEAKLKEDRTYLVRVRYKDNTGRWSHWSDPEKIIPVPAANPVQYNLVINEIMYNPTEPAQAEFIELYNASADPISLDNVQFNEGIDFEFAPGQTIASDAYICIAKDSASFFKAYGYYPFEDYGGGLSNSGELVRLVGPFRSIIDTVRYDDDIPWPATPDRGHYSLALKNPSLDNGIGSNWDIQSSFTTPCQANEFSDFGEHPFSGIVINEIHYNPIDEFDDNGDEIESGTSFEFVELKNISGSDIDMTGVFFSRGIEYYFEDNTIIRPNEFFVLAEDRSSFRDRYGFDADDKYDGKLSNNGETIALVSSNGTIMDQVTYSISFPWEAQADGGMYSLGLIDSSIDNDDYSNWCIQTNGTTVGSENIFDDIDNDTVVDCQDECVGLDDALIGTACDDNEPCSDVSIYSNCNCEAVENIALNGTASMSSQLRSFFASNLNNGVINNVTDELAHTTSTSDQEWVQIDLGSNSFISTVAIWNRNGGGSNRLSNTYLMVADTPFSAATDIDESLANADFTHQIGDVTNVSVVGVDVNVTGRYIRIQKSGNNVGGNALNIIEMQIFTPQINYPDSDNDGVCDGSDQCSDLNDQIVGTTCDDGDACTDTSIYSNCNCEAVTNFALSGTASMSSTLGNLDANNLNDGVINDNNNELAHTNNESPTDWVQIDLGSVRDISTIAIQNRTNCCTDRLSDTYLLIADTPFPTNTDVDAALANADFMHEIIDATNVSVVGIDVNISSRYVRIQKSGRDPNVSAINLREIEIFGLQTSLPDTDGDGVCNNLDQCEGSDDTIDANQDGIPDGCESCIDEIVELTNQPIVDGTSVNNNIHTNGIVLNGHIVEYIAGESIELAIGFEVEAGAVFHAYISPCSN